MGRQQRQALGVTLGHTAAAGTEQLVDHVAIKANLVFKHEHSMLIPHTAARANRDVSDAARAVTKRHVWYLKPPLAVLSLFSDRAPVGQKSGMSKKRWRPRAARNRKVLN